MRLVGYVLLAFSTFEVNGLKITNDVIISKFKTEQECIKYLNNMKEKRDELLCAPYFEKTL